MANRKKPEAPQIVLKNLSPEEIARGITKLRRRIKEVEELDPRSVRYDDQSVRNIESNITNSVREIFGPNSPEAMEVGHHDIWSGGYNYLDDEHERQRKFANGIPQSIK